MATNTLLMIGLGLAAFTLFRREETDVGETELVDASMLSSGTGDTGKALADITTIKSDLPIGGGPVLIPVTDTDVELPNFRTGPLPQVPVTPFVQTPVYILSTGEQAGQALSQIGIQTHPEEVDLITPTLYAEVVSAPGDSGQNEFTSVTLTTPVQIVPGGANVGETYFTTLETAGLARDAGLFNLEPVAWARDTGPNVFDPQAAIDALAVMTAPGWGDTVQEVRGPRITINETDLDLGF